MNEQQLITYSHFRELLTNKPAGNTEHIPRVHVYTSWLVARLLGPGGERGWH